MIRTPTVLQRDQGPSAQEGKRAGCSIASASFAHPGPQLGCVRFLLVATIVVGIVAPGACGGGAVPNSPDDMSRASRSPSPASTDGAEASTVTPGSPDSAPRLSQSDALPPPDAPAILDARTDAPPARPDAFPDFGPRGAPGTPFTTCGGPWELCCSANRCNDGGCCIGSRCTPAGKRCDSDPGAICSNGSCGACGGRGQPCCGTACTAAGAFCNDEVGQPSVCLACGGQGERCCQGVELDTSTPRPSFRCLAGLACSGRPAMPASRCIPCGLPGGPCCLGETCQGGGCCFRDVCAGPGQNCETNSVCADGLCSGCGAVGQPCCNLRGSPGRGDQCYEANTTCIVTGAVNVGTQQFSITACARCGELDQLCCGDLRCSEGLECASPKPPASSFPLRCLHCGGPGERCCGGRDCLNGGCCDGRLCVASGQACKRSPTAPDYGTCQQGSCSGCGGLGQPCCQERLDPGIGPGFGCLGRNTACILLEQTTCATCGAPGQPCCAGNVCGGGACCSLDPSLDPGSDRKRCVANGSACFANDGMCRNGSCASCGSEGDICCAGRGTGSTFCGGANLTCSAQAVCVKCGGLGQVCCDYLPKCAAPFVCTLWGCVLP